MWWRPPAATTVWVNQSAQDATVTTTQGGEVHLPPWGFVVESPRFVAFLANSWAGKDYSQPVLFTIRSEDDRTLEETDRLRVFHGFGSPEICWRGSTFVVARESVITPLTEEE